MTFGIYSVQLWLLKSNRAIAFLISFVICVYEGIRSGQLNGHDPYAYLKDVLARLPTQKNNRIRAGCKTSLERFHIFIGKSNGRRKCTHLLHMAFPPQ